MTDNKTRIVMIEDDLVMRTSVVDFVGMHEEFESIVAFNSAEEFFEHTNSQPTFSADIMLLDIGLPGRSGLESIIDIKEKLPTLDIIMLTTYEEEDVILKALCLGACSYLSKSTSLTQIIDCIRIVSKGGSYMSPSIAREIVQYLMGGQVSKATILTSRQREILQLLSEGKSNRIISEELFISYETVRSHVKNIYEVLQVNNKASAIAKYLKGEIQ